MKKLLLAALLSMMIVSTLHGQHLIKGQLVDASSSEPLIGATVIVKGTNTGTATSHDGTFALQHNGDLPVTLRISYVGYDTKEFQITEEGNVTIALVVSSASLAEVVVTARRRKEEVQDSPIPITVLGSMQIENAVAFNVNRVKELVPSVQLYSSNPRNTTLNIRGLGSTFGLTNDGIDPGVGFYVDGVYYARPAATTIDFIDIEQIEVLRGPQGTLFGKNTTAGTFNITTRRPRFKTGGDVELSYGNYGFTQAKVSVTGPLVKNKLATRLSFTGTHRDGLLYNETTSSYINTLNNVGVRGQLLYLPSNAVEILVAADHTRQRPVGYAQVFAGVAPTLRADYRQFENILADLNYDLPSRNPFDRIIDHDTPWRSGQDMGGVSINADITVGEGKVTTTSAWRYWNWDPSNDRDFTGLQGLRFSQAPSKHYQLSQEVRYAGQLRENLATVFGVFLFYQNLKSDDAHTEEAGKDQWRFSQNTTSNLWQTPGLLDGFGIKTYQNFENTSAAIFGQLEWAIHKRVSILPGIRLNYDSKQVFFSRLTYGGLDTNDPDLLALKRSVYTDQTFDASVDKTNLSGQFTVAYKSQKNVNAFATYAIGFKPVGLNLGGLPNANGQPMVELATIKPERVHHLEAGIKTQPVKSASINLTLFSTTIYDYQTLVQTADLSVNRGYLSNAEEVRVQGVEFEGSYRFKKILSVSGALSYSDARYISFTNAPPPLEETGGETFKDISGGELPGVSKWAGSLIVESALDGKLLSQGGEYFIGFDSFYRSSFSSSPSPSRYLNIDGYKLLNGRFGFRAKEGITIFLWSRNLLNKNYFEQLLPGAGNAGHYAGVLGDQRTWGLTIRLGI